LGEFSKDMLDLVKADEFNILSNDVRFIRRDLGKMIPREEFIVRLNAFNSDVNLKFHERPTIAYFKSVL